jgi:tetratricopeptide (TPR) repeat protein
MTVEIKLEQLFTLLEKAEELSSEFTGGYSGHFLSAEEFHLALAASIKKLKEGDTEEILNLYYWFTPTCFWDDFTGAEGEDLGNSIFALLTDIRKSLKIYGIIDLITDYQNAVEKVMAAFKDKFGQTDLLSACQRDNTFPQIGELNEYGIIHYAFHGIGLRATFHDNTTVNFDFAFLPEQRHDGFDLWRLEQFVAGQPDKYKKYVNKEKLEMDFNELIKRGSIVNPNVTPSTALYFFKGSLKQKSNSIGASLVDTFNLIDIESDEAPKEYGLNEMPDPNIKLYPKRAIMGFSIFFTAIAGGVLLMQNLRAIGKRKEAIFVLIFSVIYTGILLYVLNLPWQHTSSLSFVLNLGGGIILTEYFSRKYFPNTNNYQQKRIWSPLVIFTLICAAIFLAFLYSLGIIRFSKSIPLSKKMEDAIEHCRTEEVQAESVEVRRIKGLESSAPNSLNIIFKNCGNNPLAENDNSKVKSFSTSLLQEILKQIDEKDIPEAIEISFSEGHFLNTRAKGEVFYKTDMLQWFHYYHSLSYFIQASVSKLIEKNEYKEALNLCDSVILIEPQNEVAYLNRGAVEAFGFFDTLNATKDFQKVTVINNKHFQAYLNLAILYDNKKYCGLALKYVDTCLILDPMNAKAIYYRGDIRIKAKDDKNACEDFEKARRLGYKDAETAIQLYCGSYANTESNNKNKEVNTSSSNKSSESLEENAVYKLLTKPKPDTNHKDTAYTWMK